MAPQETETILLVDDESVVCGVGSMALQRHGYRVLIAKSGADGLRLFREHKDEIELVVSDISMPDMSGPDMVEAIRREGPHVSVLFISGRDDQLPDWVRETCGLLLKPFLAPAFVAKVEECLHSREKPVTRT